MILVEGDSDNVIFEFFNIVFKYVEFRLGLKVESLIIFIIFVCRFLYE